MKIIKAILITLVLLIIIVTGVGFFSPSHIRIERSITIQSPAEIIRSQVNDLKCWTKWSPWYRMDTTMTIVYHTITSGVGAGYTWNSNNKNVGSGDMTITASSKDSISTAINFMQNGIATSNFIFKKSGTGIKLTWTMESDMGANPIKRIVGLFMDEKVGADFEKGLSNLKAVVEAIPMGPKTYRGYQVKEEEIAEKLYILKKDSLSWDSIPSYCAKNIPLIYKAIEKAKIEIAGSVSNLYFNWDSVSKTAFVAVAIPVIGNAKTKVKGFETFLVSAGKNLHILYRGSYNKIGNVHYAMNDYMKENNFLQQTPVIEEYSIGPDQESDSSKWVTNVYYRVK